MLHRVPSLLLLALAFPASLHARQDLARLEMRPVELSTPSGPVTVERGSLRVPVVRADPSSQEIAVDVWRFPRVEDADPSTPPMFRLYGGPGWPGMEPADVDYAGDLLPLLRVTDVVIVGQRGIGTSTPNTVCERTSELEVEGFDGLPAEERARRIQAACGACREHWESRGYDLRGFNVIEAAADVDDVRRLLGYGRITLWGGSFGSHWSMAVLRYHPESVARAVLTGMEGPDHTYDMPGGVLAALERIAAEAEASGELDEQLPDWGLIEALREVLESVKEEPIVLEVEHPRTGALTEVSLGPEAIRELARGYTRDAGSRQGAASWPADVITLHRGDFERAARALLERRAGFGSLPTASFFMLDCGSGISPARLAELRADPAADLVGDLGWFYETACAAWGADLGEAFRSGFVTDVPTVIVHGTWDLSTPFENALELLPSFEDHHFVVVEGGTHGALGEAMGTFPEFRAGLMEFLRTGEREGLPTSLRMPPLQWVRP